MTPYTFNDVKRDFTDRLRQDIIYDREVRKYFGEMVPIKVRNNQIRKQIADHRQRMAEAASFFDRYEHVIPFRELGRLDENETRKLIGFARDNDIGVLVFEDEAVLLGFADADDAFVLTLRFAA